MLLESKEFRLVARRNVSIYGIGWVIVSIWGIFTMGRETARHISFAPFAILFTIVIVYLTLLLYMQFFHSRIQLSPAGIRYSRAQYVLSAPWSQVNGLVHRKILFVRPITELHVTGPSIQRILLFDWGNIPLLSKRESIPLGPGIWEREAELLQEIEIRVPHIKIAA